MLVLRHLNHPLTVRLHLLGLIALKEEQEGRKEELLERQTLPGGAGAPGETKRRKTEEVMKAGETRPTGVQGAEATSGDLECVIEVE